MSAADWGEVPAPNGGDVDKITSVLSRLGTKPATPDDRSSTASLSVDSTPLGDDTDGNEEEVDWDFSKPDPESNLVKSTAEVEVFANAAQAHLYQSATRFEDLGLPENLLKGVYAMGFTRPSKIQASALPMILAEPPQNMIGQSQSGTGKTAAFSLALLARIDESSDTTQAICLAPSRELARQIMDTIQSLCKYTKITTSFAIRDSVERDAKVNAHVVVGTPGTLLGLIRRRQLDVKNVKVFVLDEADNMLDQQGLGTDSKKIRMMMPKTCQVLLFSATFNKEVRAFAIVLAPNANRIVLKAEQLSVDGIKQFYMECEDEGKKLEVLLAIYGLLTIGQSIIFCRTKDTANKLGKSLTDEGHVVTILHSDLSSEDRDRVIDDFRDSKVKVLITTNVIARGIDIRQVNLVINYDLPLTHETNEPDYETYLHRIGRTGRFGRTGASINFVHNEQTRRQMQMIEDYFKRPIVKVPTNDYGVIEQILKAALK